MKVKKFALMAILLSLLVILAIVHFIPALQYKISSQGPSVSPTVAPEVPVITAMPPPTLALVTNLTLPDMNQSLFNIPEMEIPDSGTMSINTPTPTPKQPYPTPMQPMKPMDPWKPMAAMTPMLV